MDAREAFIRAHMARAARAGAALRRRGITPTFPVEDPSFRRAMAEAAWAESHGMSADALDRQPYPRADWSGDPATYYRPHSHLGGDLPPFHPWMALSLPERASLWSQGARPFPPYESSLAPGHGNVIATQQIIGALVAPPYVPEVLYRARDLVASRLQGAGAGAGDRVCISFAGARLPDGRYVDTRSPGRGLLAEGEEQPALNAVEVASETSREADRLRSLAGDEALGVPIVYSAREEWSKRVPHVGRPLSDDELPGWG